jgi:hypothetical protein
MKLRLRSRAALNSGGADWLGGSGFARAPRDLPDLERSSSVPAYVLEVNTIDEVYGSLFDRQKFEVLALGCFCFTRDNDEGECLYQLCGFLHLYPFFDF